MSSSYFGQSNVRRSFSIYGWISKKHGHCKHIWILCLINCAGFGWIYSCKRYKHAFITGRIPRSVYICLQITYFYFRFTESVMKWWIWGYWISPLMYVQNAISVNEFMGHSWDKVNTSQLFVLSEKRNIF